MSQFTDYKGNRVSVEIFLSRHLNDRRTDIKDENVRSRTLPQLTNKVIKSIIAKDFTRMTKRPGKHVIIMALNDNDNYSDYRANILLAVEPRGENYIVTVCSILTSTSALFPFKNVPLLNRYTSTKSYQAHRADVKKENNIKPTITKQPSYTNTKSGIRMVKKVERTVVDPNTGLVIVKVIPKRKIRFAS
jgi:hypothetical protein